MRKFKDLPISRKALVLGVVPAAIAVFLLFVASLVGTYLRAQRNIVRDLQGQADIVAASIEAPLAAGQPDAVGQGLARLADRDNINSACAYDAAGRLVAGEDRPGFRCLPTLDEAWANAGSLGVRHDIDTLRGRAGTLLIRGNLTRFYAWVRGQGLPILGSLVAAALIGVLLTYRLQKAVSAPILALARTADAVSVSRNYSLRAEKTTDDEVGGLVQSFNGMLDELQRQNEALTVEVAERKRAEELKDAFLAAVSHELRTPLNAILGRIQLLRYSQPIDAHLERSLESLERNARSQARLVEDLLDVSRIASGKFQMEVDVVDLRMAVNRAVEIVSPQAAAKSLRVDVHLPGLQTLVSGDSDRLQQAVVNLLSNAVKFSGHGSVEVSLVSDDQSHEYVISVRDQGIGIPADFVPKVFDRFRQADTSMTRKHGGLGLGLAIVKQVAEMHGGSASAASPGLDRGSTFMLRIPQLLQAESASIPEPKDDRITPLGLVGTRVLVVDDDPDSLDVAEAALTTAGGIVTRAVNGEQAIQCWKDGVFDALVCDLAMPDMDGFEVLRRIRSLSQTGPGFVAIAVTAYASSDYRARTRVAGFEQHLAKPYSTSELMAILSDAMRGRHKSVPVRATVDLGRTSV